MWQLVAAPTGGRDASRGVAAWLIGLREAADEVFRAVRRNPL